MNGIKKTTFQSESRNETECYCDEEKGSFDEASLRFCNVKKFTI